MNETEMKMKILEMEIAIANLTKVCNNLQEQIDKLNEGGSGTGIFLDGVPDYYKKELESELSRIKR